MYEPLQRKVDVHKYYPDNLKDILEFSEISKVENVNFNKVRINLLKAFSMRFVHDADEIGISRWEKMLNLKRRTSDDVEVRRMRVLAKLNNKIPYTWRSLQQLLNSIFGEGNYHLNLDPQDFVMELLIPTEKNYYKELQGILEPMIPLNILMIIAEGVLKEIIQISSGAYGWSFNKKIAGRFKTASRPAIIADEQFAQKENIYTFPLHGRVSGRFRAGGAL